MGAVLLDLYDCDWTIPTVGYMPKTDIWDELNEAEHHGYEQLKQKIEFLYAQHHNNVVAMTELVMALNWKIWHWYEDSKLIAVRAPRLIAENFAQIYNEYWEKYDAWCMDNWQDENLRYYLTTTD